jgi:hypothetical protein
MLFHFFSLAFFLLGVSCTKIQSEALPKQEIAGDKSPLHSFDPAGGGFECNGLWLLKKSILLKTAEIWGIENVYPNRESRL